MFLFGLNQSLWLDEAISANVARNYSIIDIITKFSPSDFHPPLYYIILKFWTSIFGFSEISLRLPSLIFALIATYFIFKISKNFWASLLFICNPLIVYYSQEARMYLLVTMFLIIGYYFFVQQRYRLFNLFVFFSFLTFYGSVFFIITFYLYLVIKKQFRLQYAFGFIAALILISPLLQLQLVNAQKSQALVPNWHSVLGVANLKNLLLIPVKFTSGRISFYPKIIYYLISGLWAVWIFSIFRRRPIYLYFFCLPLILGVVFSFFSPLLQYFRFIYLIPILCFALSESRFRSVALVGFVIFSSIYLFNPTFHREDWQSLSKSLPKNSTVYMIPSFADPLNYYRPDITILDSREGKLPSTLSLIPYGETIHGFDHLSKLMALGYQLQATHNFRGLTLENWTLQKQ